MIRASCGGAHLTVRGHAGYGEYGKDIVCAAASALVRCGLALLAQQYPGRVEVGS